MTIGQKIVQLRNDASISQEQLAETLGVSRQSVSKWEMDQALPQIDKVIQLCEIFKISTDSLLQENIKIAEKSTTAGSDNTNSYKEHTKSAVNNIRCIKHNT